MGERKNIMKSKIKVKYLTKATLFSFHSHSNIITNHPNGIRSLI